MKALSALTEWVDEQRREQQLPQALSELGWIASLAKDCDTSEQAAASLMSRIALILGWGEATHEQYALTWEIWLGIDLSALTVLTDLAMPDDATRIEHMKDGISDWWDELGLEIDRAQAYSLELRRIRHAVIMLQLWFTERDNDTVLRMQVFETFVRKQLAALVAADKRDALDLGRQDVYERCVAALEHIQECQVWLPRVIPNQHNDVFFPEWETPTHRWVARVEPQFLGRKLVLSISSLKSYRRLKAGGFAARETVSLSPQWQYSHTHETYKAAYDAWIAETIGPAVYRSILTACREAIAFA